MDFTSTILAIAIAQIVVAVVPGPNFLIVSRNALVGNRKAGLLTVMGIAVGNSIYICCGFVGFSTIVMQSALLFNAIKILGSLYLIYLGITALYRPDKNPESEPNPMQGQTVPDLHAFRSGFLTTLSNPKAALHFLILFTTLISPTALIGEKFIIYVVLIAILSGWYSLVATAFSTRWFRRLYRRSQRTMQYVFGGLFIVLGLKLMTVQYE